MTAGAPWSVKGIDPKAREVAKHHARRSGMTLGEWLNRVILEDEAAAAGGDYAAPDPLRSGEELARVAGALDRLTDRMEAAETRTGLAISGVEHSVRQALARIDVADRESLTVAARIDGAVEQLGGEQSRLAERLRRIETEAGPRSSEALRAIEQSVIRMGGQMHEAEVRIDEVVQALGVRLSSAEAHTAEALEGLRTSLASLDGRVGALDGGTEDPRFEALARSLAEQVEAVRTELSGRIAAVDGGRIDRRFAELARQVKAAEQRSGRAVQQLGRDVLAMAEVVNRRMQSAEERSAEALSKASEEMSRIAGALEARLGHAEQAHAEALDRLSGELGKISDRLSERLLISERRAAEAIDNVGEQVSRVTERMAQSQERAAHELADRIRESEERTARLLEETRARLEQRLGESPAGAQRLAEAAAAAPVLFAPAAEALAAVDAPKLDSAEPDNPVPDSAELDKVDEPELHDRSLAEAPAAAAFGPELFSRAEEFEDELDQLELSEAAPFAPARPDLTADFAPIPEPEGDLFDLDQPEPPEENAAAASLSTREVIEQARAAARAAAPEPIEQLRLNARANWRSMRPGRLGSMFFGPRTKRTPNSTLQTAILVAGGAAFLSVGAAGVVLVQGSPASKTGQAPANSASPARASVALAAPELSGLPADRGPRPPAQLQDALQNAFTRSAIGVKAGEAGALAKVRALAEAGHPPAQFFLAKLYEGGQYGVPQNWTEARRWTQRAAEGGDAGAMHNLALYDFRGEGGPQDLKAAARWFRAAAERGIVDSQYNLGLLYQSGSGVERDLSQAYIWFAIAASKGDVQGRINAERIQAKLTHEQRAAADEAIGAFAARAPAQDAIASIDGGHMP